MAELQLFANNPIAILAESITPSDLHITVGAGYGSLYPQPAANEFFLVTLEDIDPPLTREIVKIVARVGDVLYVATDGRGYEDTSAKAWQADATLVDHRITAGTLRRLQETGESNIPGIATTSANVDPGWNNVVNSLPIGEDRQSCKWLITVYDEQHGALSTCEALGVWKEPPYEPHFVVYGKIGDPLPYKIKVASTPTTLDIKVENNGASPFTVDVVRIQHR